MERYTTKGSSRGGMPPISWIAKYAENSTFDQALVAEPVKARRDGVNLNILGVVPLVEAFKGRFGIIDTSIAKDGCVIIPFRKLTGSSIHESYEDLIVMQQASRDLVTMGKNTGAMNNENVVTAYYSALQNVAFAMASSLSKQERADIADTFFAIVNTYKQFMKHHPDVCKKLATAIIQDASAADSLQKAIAAGFHPDEAKPIDLLRLLETVLKRHVKWCAKEGKPVSLLGSIPGPLAVLLISPLIQSGRSLSVYRDAEKNSLKQW